MATYINGVTDYLPQIQPFKPDLNFYNAVLQTKENQYEQGYQKISRLYGTLLNSPMLRESDIKKRDEFFKQIQQEIQKVSMVDLSLEQNVNAARQIFQPLINDKNIISDMGYTKMYNQERERAESLRNCVDTDKRKCEGYWMPGVQNLEYWREDYQRTTDQEALKFTTPRYVPSVDMGSDFQKMMKDNKFKVVNTGLSRDNRFIIKQTNGEQMVTDLSNYLGMTMGKDPRVVDMYRVLAENSMHDWVNQNSNRFGGDYGAAEDAYFRTLESDVFSKLKQNKDSLDKSNNLLNSKIKAVKKEIDDSPNGVSEENELLKILGSLIQEKDVADSATDQVNSSLENMKNIGIFSDDRMAKRRFYNASLGNILMQNDLYKMAYAYAMNTSETEFKINDYQRDREKNAMALNRDRMKFQMDLERDYRKSQYKLEEIKLKESLKKDKSSFLNPVDEYTPMKGVESTKGAATGEIDELYYQFGKQQKIYQEGLNYKASAVKQFYSDLANIADNSTDDVARGYARSYIEWNFGKPKAGESYSQVELKNPEKYYKSVETLISDPTFKRNFGSITSNIETDIRNVNLEAQALSSVQNITRNNIKNLYNYLIANKEKLKDATPNDIGMMQVVIDSNSGSTRSAEEIYKKLKPGNPSFTMEDAEDVRTKYSNLFRNHYKAGYTMGTPGKEEAVVKPYNWSAGQPINTGGIAAQPVSSRIGISGDTYNKASGDAQEMYRYFKNNQGTPNMTLYKGQGVTKDQTEDFIETSSAQYQFLDYALNTMMSDMGKKKTENKLSEGISLTLHPIIANNENMRGVSFNIPEAVFNKWKKDGKITGVSYEDYANLTLVMPANAAPSSVFNRFDPKPIKTILDSGKSVEINFPNAGNIQFMRRSDGTIATSGVVKYLDTDGTLKPSPANSVGVNPNMDPDYAYWRLVSAMKQLDYQNYQGLISPLNPKNVGNIRSGEQAEQFIRSRMQGQ